MEVPNETQVSQALKSMIKRKAKTKILRLLSTRPCLTQKLHEFTETSFTDSQAIKQNM